MLWRCQAHRCRWTWRGGCCRRGPALSGRRSGCSWRLWWWGAGRSRWAARGPPAEDGPSQTAESYRAAGGTSWCSACGSGYWCTEIHHQLIITREQSICDVIRLTLNNKYKTRFDTNINVHSFWVTIVNVHCICHCFINIYLILFFISKLLVLCRVTGFFKL